ncbi:hypothetical protein BD414DRAFT_294770 [Trametes punicea]|nr:hypothetical protein BD414DRAFT_294770 [Trametes punicea]
MPASESLRKFQLCHLSHNDAPCGSAYSFTPLSGSDDAVHGAYSCGGQTRHWKRGSSSSLRTLPATTRIARRRTGSLTHSDAISSDRPLRTSALSVLSSSAAFQHRATRAPADLSGATATVILPACAGRMMALVDYAYPVLARRTWLPKSNPPCFPQLHIARGVSPESRVLMSTSHHVHDARHPLSEKHCQQTLPYATTGPSPVTALSWIERWRSTNAILGSERRPRNRCADIMRWP